MSNVYVPLKIQKQFRYRYPLPVKWNQKPLTARKNMKYNSCTNATQNLIQCFNGGQELDVTRMDQNLITAFTTVFDDIKKLPSDQRKHFLEK